MSDTGQSANMKKQMIFPLKAFGIDRERLRNRQIIHNSTRYSNCVTNSSDWYYKHIQGSGRPGTYLAFN